MSMISEFVEKLREKAALFSKSDFAVMGIAKDYKEAADVIEELSEKLSSANLSGNLTGWISCSERLPEYKYGESNNVLTTIILNDGETKTIDLAYFDGGCWCYAKGEKIGRVICFGKVIAWQPLPDSYKPEPQKETKNKARTRIEHLRTMSVEELADVIINSEISTAINFCSNDKECEEMLDGGVIEDEKCKKCLIKWLNTTEESKTIPTEHFTERFNRVM